MKAKIIISGSGIISKTTLLRKIPYYQSQLKSLPNNNYSIEFKTKKEAIKALAEGNKKMKEDWETKQESNYKRGQFLTYDAGSANIQ
jgi:hypothetical protein